MLAEAANAATDRTQILGALQRASAATGADFNYLLDTAMRESGLKPTAKAATSSAAGLFQFVDQTWLGMVKNCGAKYGLGDYANAISQGNDGRFHVANSADRRAILALRKDPEVASLMEGEMAQATRATLQQSLGRDVCGGELYAAHFLGPDAACRLIKMSDSHPDASAAHAFPAAADANRHVFFHSNGTPKTVREVYNWALGQPSGTAALATATPAVSAPATVVDSSIATTPDQSALLSSIASWRPAHGFFSSGFDDAANGGPPSAPFLMTPGVMDLLASVGTVADARATD